MTKPIIHGPDHGHGGPDPVRITYEIVGGTASPGTGIQFDTDNEGGWLYIGTNDATEASGSPSGYGISLYDNSGAGVDISAPGSDVTIGPNGIRLYNTYSNGIRLDDSYTASDGNGVYISSFNSVILSSGVGTGTAGVYLNGWNIYMPNLHTGTTIAGNVYRDLDGFLKVGL